MTRKMRTAVLGLVVLVLAMATLPGAAAGLRTDSKPATEQKTVVFSDFRHAGTAIADGAYSLDSVRSIDDPMVLQTKSAVLVTLADGARSTMNMVSFENGIASYTFTGAAGAIDPQNTEIVFPTLYVEEQAAQPISIPLAGGSGLIKLTVRDSREVFPNADSAVLVEFTAPDVTVLPYNPVLVSNGKTYDCEPSYYFDTKTGDFTHGQLVFAGITVGELAADAVLTTARTFCQYIPATYSLAQ